MEKKDPLLEMNKHLETVRSTLHISTGQIPADLLFGRKYRARIPNISKDPALDRPDMVEARAADEKTKAIQR